MLSVNIDHKSFVDVKTPIFKNLSFKLEKNEIVVIMGPSGIGKTTLLNLISGLDKKYQGEINFSETSQKKLVKSFIFQEPRLMPWLTVLENVILVVDSTEQNLNRANKLLSKVGLADAMDIYPNQLSGGMRRRVALARAFLPKPQMLLMDEPFVSLDVPAVQRLMDVFISLWDEVQPTTICVTHDINEAITLADRILFLGNSPANVILEKTILLKRPRSNNSEYVRAKKRDLFMEYPNILKGMC